MMSMQNPKPDRDLRDELDAAIQIQRAADARAELAKEKPTAPTISCARPPSSPQRGLQRAREEATYAIRSHVIPPDPKEDRFIAGRD